MDRGEIWLVSLDPIAGHEQSGKRPVLIVSKASFNKLTRLPVVVPVTSGGHFARTAGFTKAGFLNLASLTGIAIASNWLISKLNLNC